MSQGDDTTATPAAASALRGSTLPKIIVAICLGALALLAVLTAAGRYGVLLPQVRQLIEARTDGLKVSRYGRLKIEGLSGDVWRDFRVRRLTLRDDKGVWLEADNLHMAWRYSELFRRRFHAQAIEAQRLRVLRRPILTAAGPPTPNPVSVRIDNAQARIEMLPAFSYERGVYDVGLGLDMPRSGGQRGQVRAASVLHPGDHLNLDFDLGKDRPLVLRVDGREARGGALAGALGLPANQAFDVKIDAGGRMSQGRFTAAATSGALRPLDATGAWSPGGGQAQGRLSLTASSLTAPYARRFGPEVRFAIAGRKATNELYALDAGAAAENLTIHAQGLGDIGEMRLGPKGLAVAATTNALSKITGGPDIGPTRVNGLLTGDRKAWRFRGEGAATRLALAGGYSLEQVAGPLELSRKGGAFNVTAQLAGRGGRGAGWLAALLGGAPRMTLDAARLADGRLALRRLDVDGRGLKVQASGDRGLLGGLAFKGEAELSNLAEARAGAAGLVRLNWSAVQTAGGKPWTFTLDSQGEKLATGYAELDRLLGPRPRFTGQASLEGRRLSLAKANLEGAAISAATAGVLAPDGALSFKLDWNASGPFHAGPVEITGKAKGTGAVTGSLSAPRADLLADVETVDLPRLPLKNAHLTLSFLRKADGSSGMIALAADSAYGPAKARSDFRFPASGVDLTGLAVDAGGLKAQGSLSLRRNAPSAADLTLAVNRGALLEAGRVAGTVRIVDATGGAQANLDLAAENARMPGSTVTLLGGRLTAKGPLSQLPYALQAKGVSGAGRFAADGRGVFARSDAGYGVSFDGSGRLGARALRTVEPATFRFGGAERAAHLRLAAADGGRIDLDGRLTEQDAEVKARLAGLGLGLLDEDLAGKVDADIALQGRKGRLDGSLDARLTDARGRGAPAASAVDSVVRGRLTGDTLALDATATNEQGLKANASLVLPTETSGAPFRLAIARKQPMRGRFFADGEVRPLWDLLVGGERSLSGHVSTEGTIAGTLAEPSLAGRAQVAGGRFDDGLTGLSLRDVALRADFAQGAVDVSSAQGVDGRGGTVNGSGRISLQRNGISNFRLDLHQFRLIDNELATASASGQATIARAADGKVKLSGALTIDRADVQPSLPSGSDVISIDVVEKNRPAEMVAASPTPQVRGAGWALDVTLQAPGHVFLRGKGLDVELSLDAHVGGTTSQPSLSGRARVVRGDYEFAGKRFEFDPESVVYLSTRARDVRLDLTAARDDPSLTAVARIRGTAAKPEITFTSTPTLPNDEVLSQVLFGRSASQLSPLEAAQLASALSSLARGGGLDVIGNLRTFAGLDRLALGGGDASGVTVSGGKYITDKVYLEITGGGREGPTAQVEWRVRRSLSILSRIGSQAGARLAVRWRRDY